MSSGPFWGQDPASDPTRGPRKRRKCQLVNPQGLGRGPERRTSCPVNLHPQADGTLPTHPLVPVHGASLDRDDVNGLWSCSGPWEHGRYKWTVVVFWSLGACSGNPGSGKKLVEGVGGKGRVDTAKGVWLQSNPFPLRCCLRS